MSLYLSRSAALLAALLTGAAALPSSLLAQHGASDARGSPAAQMSLIPTSAPVDTTRAAPAAGPRIAPVGFTTAVVTGSPGPARPINDTSAGENRNVAMMGVGAAAVGLGLIIGGQGGTMVAVSGAVVGLVGLYRYLR